MPKINIDGFELFYESRGSGYPLVLIPGVSSGAWNWYKQVDELSGSFRVITFDPRGISRSLLPEGIGAEISIPALAGDVAALLDDLGIAKAHVLGASFGGFVAQEFALRFPERLRKLVLVCTSFGGMRHVAPRAEVMQTFTAAAGMSTAERIRTNLGPAFESEFAKRHPEIVEEVCLLREANPVPEDIYYQQFKAAMTFDAEEQVGEIRAETLVITGSDDAIVPMANSENLAAAIAGSRLEVIADGGHLFFIEQPETFNRAVTGFLSD